MSATTERRISQVLTANESEILAEWLKRQKEEGRTRYDEAEAREKSTHFLKLFAAALEHGNIESPGGPHWQDIFDMLSDLSRTRAQLGFSPSETATFVFSLKQPLFDRLRREFGNDAQALADSVWSSTNLLDKLGLYTTEMHQKSREEVISAPAAGAAGALDAGGRAVGRHPGAAAHRHARQRAHAGRDGEPARSASSRPARASRSSTSPACRRWTPSSRSTC